MKSYVHIISIIPAGLKGSLKGQFTQITQKHFLTLPLVVLLFICSGFKRLVSEISAQPPKNWDGANGIENI